MTHQLNKHDLTELVMNLCFTELTAQYAAIDGALVVECETDEDALEAHQLLTQGFPVEVLDIRHYPVTDDDTGTVECWHLQARYVTYDRDSGWWSTDLPEEPDVEYLGDPDAPSGLDLVDNVERYEVTD